MTVDVINDCTLLTPCDVRLLLSIRGRPRPGAASRYDNVLWGDWYMIDYANDFAQGDTWSTSRPSTRPICDRLGTP